jgi:hypothetical protein
MVEHARRNDRYEDARSAFLSEHLCAAICGTICGIICGAICGEIFISIGAYLPGVQMSKGTITAKGKA